MKRIIGIIFVVLLVLVGGYFYVKILLEAGPEIKIELPETEETVVVVEKDKTIAAQAEQGLSVTGGLGTDVEKYDLVGEAAEFNADVGRVYCLTTITGASAPTEIEHVWYFNNKEMIRTNLPIKYKRHRTWSYKTIRPEWIGNWRVDVVDASGKVLKSFPFVIR